MTTSARIALVTRDPATVQAVTSAVKAGGLGMFEPVPTLERMVDQLAHAQAAAAIVDIDPDGAATLDRLAPIVSQMPETRFIVVCKTLDSELMLRAMEIGARHFVDTASIATKLPEALQRLIAGSPTGPVRRGIVPVLAASGGCGATTTAINLANELRQIAAEPTLLVDLDCHYGVADSYLGLSGEYGLADVLNRPGSIDADLIRSTAIDHEEGFSLLRSPASQNLPSEATLNRERLGEMINACAEGFAFTIFDAPRVPMSIATDLAESSVMTFVILQMTVKDLRVARSILTVLNDRGIGPERIVPVINRYSKRGLMIAPAEAEKALGRPFSTISNDYRNIVRSVNYGQPLEQTAPRCQCRRDLQELAERVIAAAEQPRTSATR